MTKKTVELYCERSSYDEQTGYEIILDFTSYENLRTVMELRNIPVESNNIKTLLLIDSINTPPFKVPRSGTWYEIPLDYLSELIESEQRFDSSLILLKLSQTKLQTTNFTEWKVEGKKIVLPKEYFRKYKKSGFWKELNSLKKRNPDIKFTYNLTVRNVGCGNFNEIFISVLKERFHIVYDFGGDVKYNRHQMIKILNRVNFNKSIYGVISHWDVDHYWGLLIMTDNQIKSIRNILAPMWIPDTLMAKAVLSRLKSLNISLHILVAPIKTRNRIDLVSQGEVCGVELYRSVDGASINQSGIVLTVKGENGVGVLPGDHHYSQLKNAIFSKRPADEYALVVPHHAGNAGIFIKAYWTGIRWFGGAISTKPRKFGVGNLPNMTIHDVFIGESFHCTNCTRKDYDLTL